MYISVIIIEKVLKNKQRNLMKPLQNCPNVFTVCFYITYISIYNLREDTNLNTIKQKNTQIILDKPLFPFLLLILKKFSLFLKILAWLKNVIVVSETKIFYLFLLLN